MSNVEVTQYFKNGSFSLEKNVEPNQLGELMLEGIVTYRLSTTSVNCELSRGELIALKNLINFILQDVGKYD